MEGINESEIPEHSTRESRSEACRKQEEQEKKKQAEHGLGTEPRTHLCFGRGLSSIPLAVVSRRFLLALVGGGGRAGLVVRPSLPPSLSSTAPPNPNQNPVAGSSAIYIILGSRGRGRASSKVVSL